MPLRIPEQVVSNVPPWEPLQGAGFDHLPKRMRQRLDGPAAIEWFEARGHSLSTSDASLNETVLVVDELSDGEFTARRLWHTPLNLLRDTQSTADRGVRFSLQVDGTITIAAGDTTTTQTTNDIVVVSARHRCTLQAQSPTARIEVETSSATAQLPGGFLYLPFDEPTCAGAGLAALLNTALNLTPSPHPAVIRKIHGAIDLLIEGLLDEHRPRAGSTLPALDRLYEDAMECIRSSAHNPATTVASLADTLDVSRQYLARAFASRGTSPSSALRMRRLELLDSLRRGGVASPGELAHLSGFRSTWAMHNAAGSTFADVDN
ncbi:hypothetical protein [Microbacterium sp. LMI1-1-1.1]|uniref:hypothetical protein n=1 Tax=Microbacterium sp. LMI1-1-1.1 TaxID=3135223 RepID=UPI003466B557